jgi:NACHT domain/Ankyrin repeats (many copies)/Ankyrin repeats (3 copies)
VANKALNQFQSTLDQHIQGQNVRYQNDKQHKCHQVFKTSKYEQFKDNNPDRASGTCRWVLDDDKYAQWQQAQKDDLLWISADPGCGKSVLARSLVDQELQSTEMRTTCYFFFKDNEEQDSLATALCALLHQLFSAQSQLLPCAMDSWEKNSRKLQFEVGELWRILLTATTSEEAKPVVIVMDALDECREKDRQTLMRLLSNFYVKCSRSASQSSRLKSRSRCLKFLVTSRPYKEIEDGFDTIGPRLPTIRLRGELKNDRIHKEIDIVVRERVDALASRNALSPTTTEKLKLTMLNMKHRTYLWLHLAMKDIENSFKSFRSDSETIESLRFELPTSVEDAYEKILMRVPTFGKGNVIQIFHIILGARRPLTTSEMAIALGILRRRGTEPFAKFTITEDRLKKSIRDLCGLFIFINHSKIYLIHQTAKEFLVQREFIKVVGGLWRHSLKLSESETIMARICVEYLSLDELYHTAPKTSSGRHTPIHQTTPDDRRQEMGEENEIEALLSYSSEHWPDHFRIARFEQKDALVSKARELCRIEDDQFRLWFPVFSRTFPSYTRPTIMNSSMMLAAFNGHEMILRMVFDDESVILEEKGDMARTALIWAAELGHVRVVDLLLKKGANVNAQGGMYGNALQAASRAGQEEVVQMLLNKGAKVNAQGGAYGNALQAASSLGHENVVQILLNKGAEVNAQGGPFGNALQGASSAGHERVVQILLNKGAELHAQGGLYKTATNAALHGGHVKVKQMLMRAGADCSQTTQYSGTVGSIEFVPNSRGGGYRWVR